MYIYVLKPEGDDWNETTDIHIQLMFGSVSNWCDSLSPKQSSTQSNVNSSRI